MAPGGVEEMEKGLFHFTAGAHISGIVFRRGPVVEGGGVGVVELLVGWMCARERDSEQRKRSCPGNWIALGRVTCVGVSVPISTERDRNVLLFPIPGAQQAAPFGSVQVCLQVCIIIACACRCVL